MQWGVIGRREDPTETEGQVLLARTLEVCAGVVSYLSSCSQRKTPTPKNLAPLQIVTVSSPMQKVAIDILGPLPITLAGNKYILVAADYFSKWIEAYATTIARKLLDEMFCRFALPEKLHSDQGRQFEAEVTTQLCQFLQIEKTRTTPYHPQSDGLVIEHY